MISPTPRGVGASVQIRNEERKKKRHLPADDPDGRRWRITIFDICVNPCHVLRGERDLRAIPELVAAGRAVFFAVKCAICNGNDKPRMDTDEHGWEALLVIRVHPRSSAVQIRNLQSAIRNSIDAIQLNHLAATALDADAGHHVALALQGHFGRRAILCGGSGR